MRENANDKNHALVKLGAAIFGCNNLIGTDFGDVRVRRIERKFVKGGLVQDTEGVRIVFSISNHALGKVIGNQEEAEALSSLLSDERKDTSM